MEYDYPLLQKVFGHYKKHIDLANTKLYSCMHLLEPQAEMYKKFIEFGFLPKNITALGKIYSSSKEIIQELTDLGINALQPEFSGRSFDWEHAENCRRVAATINGDAVNIILDDGGYLIYEARGKAIHFAVEQTSSGYRKLENESLPFPIFNVARSKTKLTQESPIVARQIFELTSEYLEQNKIADPKILIVGLGPIGEATFQIFKADNSNVVGIDIETTKSELIQHLSEQKPDLVIGATGSMLLSATDLQLLEGGHVYHFVSVSSSDREFPVAEFRGAGKPHDHVRYKNFVFVNNGFPITFKGLRNALTPIEIEKTIALLMGSVLHGLVDPAEQEGFIEVPEELQDLINS